MHSKKYCKTSDCFTANFCMLAILITTLAVYLASCASFDHLTKVTPQFPQAAECGKCHVEIYREWSQSNHAKAFVNYHYNESTNNYSLESCLGCHAPQPTVTNKVPTVRSTHRKEGITCVSCHLREGKLSGPIDPTGIVTPHPIEVNPEFYRNSDICGRCHEGTLAEWKTVKTNEKKTCQHCHMPPVNRKLTQSTGILSKIIVAFEHKVPQKRHDFAIPSAESSIDILSVKAKKVGSLVTMTIRNNLPHSLPTGNSSDSTLFLEAYARNSKGKETFVEQRELTKKLNTSIPARSNIDWQLKIPPDSVLELRLLRFSYDGDITHLADFEVPLQ